MGGRRVAAGGHAMCRQGQASQLATYPCSAIDCRGGLGKWCAQDGGGARNRWGSGQLHTCLLAPLAACFCHCGATNLPPLRSPRYACMLPCCLQRVCWARSIWTWCGGHTSSPRRHTSRCAAAAAWPTAATRLADWAGEQAGLGGTSLGFVPSHPLFGFAGLLTCLSLMPCTPRVSHSLPPAVACLADAGGGAGGQLGRAQRAGSRRGGAGSRR